MKKRQDGRFCKTITIHGARKFVYGDSPEDVENQIYELRKELEKGMKPGAKITLAEWMVDWYNTYKRKKGALKTQEMYKNIINNHINPSLGDSVIKEIKAIDIQRFLNSIDGSKSLIHKVRITLNQIFRAAMVNGYIGFNPVIGSTIEAIDDPKRECLSEIQRNILLEALKDHKGYVFISSLLYTGMRRGEALGLTWNDIDLDAGLIKVNKAIEFDGTHPRIKAPKTKKGKRTIPIPLELGNILKDYKKGSKSLYVFPKCGKDGIYTKTSIDNLWRKINGSINRYFKAHPDLKGHYFALTYRMLRHTYATGLFDANIDELSAAEIMGHDPNIMRGIYTHIQEGRKIQTIAKINNIYKPITLENDDISGNKVEG